MRNIPIRSPGPFLWMVGTLLVVTLGSCGESLGDGPEWLAARAQPVELKTVPENDRAASRVITPAGGTVSATGSDGTLYRLRIPEGALLSDARITLTPLRSVDGLPLEGGSLGAAQLEPSGLRLMEHATLTIRTRARVPAAEQVAFGYYGAGDDAHLVPLSPDPRRIEIPVLHFSGYGFARAAPNDPGRQALQRAKSMEARLDARIAEATARERSRGEEAASKELERVLGEAVIEYYDHVLRELMRTAETDERMAACAMQRWVAWERRLQLTGSDDDPPAGGKPGGAAAAGTERIRREIERRRAEARNSSAAILDNAYNKGLKRIVRDCREEHDFSGAERLITLSRQMQLTGVPDDDERLREAQEELRKCMTFEVEFRSIFDNRAPGLHLRHHVEAKIPVEVGNRGGTPPTSGPLRYVEHVTSGDGATMWSGSWFSDSFIGVVSVAAVGTRPGTMTVHRLDWDVNPKEVPGTNCDGEDDTLDKKAAENFTITFQPGVPTDISRAMYRRIPPQTMEDHTWANMWGRMHTREVVSAGSSASGGEGDGHPNPIFRFALQATAPGEWRADFKRAHPASEGVSFAEDGYLVLRHTPKK